MEKPKKKLALKNAPFIVALIVLIFVGILSFIFSNKFFVEEYDNNHRDLIGILCQIIISVACCIVSVISISISLQNEKIYGITRRDFEKLRTGMRFSILCIILVALSLSVISVIAYTFEIYFTCLYCLTLLIAFCFIICISEVPIMCHNDNTILRIIMKRLKIVIMTGVVIPSDLKTVVINLITEKHTIKELYNKYKDSKNKEYNKSLLIKLIEIHCDYASNLAKLDANIRDKRADRVVKNIKDILSFNKDFDIIQLTDKEIWNYQHLITRVLFSTSKIVSTHTKTIHLIFDTLPFIDHYENVEHKRFIMSIAIKLISATLTSGDLSFAYELKRVCSQWKYSFNDGGALTTIFALTSIHLEYLHNSARYVTQKYKVRIRKFIKDNPVIESQKTLSWATLYSIFLQKFTLNVEEFLYFYKLNEHNWDMNIYDSDAHFVIMDDKHGVMWLLANLFSTYTVWTYDYNKLLSINPAFHETLLYVGDQILEDRSTIEYMQKLVTFFVKGEKIDFYNISEKKSQRFETFIRELHKKKIDKLVAETELIDTDELAKMYEVAVVGTVSKEWGYTGGFDLSEVAPNVLKMMIEVNSTAINYVDFIIKHISKQVILKIKSDIHKELASPSTFEESIKEAESLYVSNIAKQNVEQILTKNALSDKVAIESFESTILDGYCVLVNKALEFGCDIKIEIEKLTKRQIAEKAEEYKAKDGRYIYEGAILSREELESIVQKQYAFLVLQLKYKVNKEDITVYKINYLDLD